MKDVADLAGVSITSVSHVINKTRKVEDGTKEKILWAIEKLNYRPNVLARSLKGKGTRTIGVIIADIREDFFSEVVKSIESNANEKDYSVILCDSEEKVEKEKFYLKMLLSKGVDGIIFAPVNSEETYLNLLSTHTPFVQIDRKMSFYKADFVGIDNQRSSYDAAKYLIGKGCKTIGFIGYNDLVFTQKLRKIGYKKALQENNAFNEDLLLEVAYHGDATGDALKEYFAKHMDIDAVICGTSNICFETLDTIDRMGIFKQKDVLIVSYDDSKWFDFLKYPINVILQPTEAIGRIATDLVIERIQETHEDQKKQVILDTEFIRRDKN